MNNYSKKKHLFKESIMPRIDELRLIARVARMYYEWELRQSEIAKQLGLSQAPV